MGISVANERSGVSGRHSLIFVFLLTSVIMIQGHNNESGPVSRKTSAAPNTNPNSPLSFEKSAVFKERVQERAAMVASQIKGRDVRDPMVLRAMHTVPRHAFVPVDLRTRAYTDGPLPIEQGQTISQPYIVAFMTEAMNLDPNDRVLEIGTGSGYQAAVCAEIVRKVYTIEIIDALAKTAQTRLSALGYTNIHAKAGDGYHGWPGQGPFDAIIGTAAAGRIPEPLLKQLKPGGRMILPKEDPAGFQYLVLITKDKSGNIHTKRVLPVRFVPMTGEVDKG
jgi:protein-L-isoaspartate(D-aspartate) O-methyltransferase